MYKALRQCKFDRKYGTGEVIQDGVADKECLARAVAYGYIKEIDGEVQEALENECAEETEPIEHEAEIVPFEPEEEVAVEAEPVEAKRRGRKKAVV